MKIRLPIMALAGSCLLLAASCSNEGPVPAAAPEKAAKQLTTAFSTTDDAFKQAINKISDALRENRFEEAYLALTGLKNQPNLTPEQSDAVRESMRSVQTALSEAVVRGDTNAIRLMRAMGGGR